MASVGSTPLADPSGVQAGIDRYRDLAKYVVTIFAAVAATMLAGTQLSSIGSLTWDDDKARIVIAALGFLVAFIGIFKVISSALSVLKPIEMSLDQIDEDEALRGFVESRRISLLNGLDSVSTLRDLLQSVDVLDPAERPQWADLAEVLVDRVAYEKVRREFEAAWQSMVVWAVVGAIGIVAFVWAANPPDTSPPDSGAQSVLVSAS